MVVFCIFFMGWSDKCSSKRGYMTGSVKERCEFITLTGPRETEYQQVGTWGRCQ